MKDKEILNTRECCELLRVSRRNFDGIKYRAGFPAPINLNKGTKKAPARRWFRSEIVEWAKNQQI